MIDLPIVESQVRIESFTIGYTNEQTLFGKIAFSTLSRFAHKIRASKTLIQKVDWKTWSHSVTNLSNATSDRIFCNPDRHQFLTSSKAVRGIIASYRSSKTKTFFFGIATATKPRLGGSLPNFGQRHNQAQQITKVEKRMYAFKRTLLVTALLLNS